MESERLIVIHQDHDHGGRAVWQGNWVMESSGYEAREEVLMLRSNLWV